MVYGAKTILGNNDRKGRWTELMDVLGSKEPADMAQKVMDSKDKRKTLTESELLNHRFKNLLFSIVHTSMDLPTKGLRFANFFRVISQCKLLDESVDLKHYDKACGFTKEEK